MICGLTDVGIGFFLGFHATFPREIDYVFD